jgi:secreted Zn-dependent insulinase-like peptidase
VQSVLTRIFQYIGLLAAASGISEELFNDAAALSKLGFDYREHPNAFSYTSNLANLMHDYPTTALLLIRHHVMQKFDESSIRKVLECLNPDEAIIMWTSHEHSADGMLTEPWCVLKLP